jgi:hypothetical protein
MKRSINSFDQLLLPLRFCDGFIHLHFNSVHWRECLLSAYLLLGQSDAVKLRAPSSFGFHKWCIQKVFTTGTRLVLFMPTLSSVLLINKTWM